MLPNVATVDLVPQEHNRSSHIRTLKFCKLSRMHMCLMFGHSYITPLVPVCCTVDQPDVYFVNQIVVTQGLLKSDLHLRPLFCFPFFLQISLSAIDAVCLLAGLRSTCSKLSLVWPNLFPVIIIIVLCW